MNLVCLQFDAEGRARHIGRPNRNDPKSGKPLRDDTMTWRTRNPLCQTCGEMLGTSRSRYGRNRWPATVEQHSCRDCDAQICDRCTYWYTTQQIVGWRDRYTEGRHKIRVPRYAEDARCPSCAAAYRAIQKPRQANATEELLGSLGLTIR